MIKTKLCVVDVGAADDPGALQKVETASEHFASYLDYWPARGMSKHTLMGPVADILDTLRREDATSGSLLGRAMRVHELAAGQAKPEAVAELERSVQELFRLISSKKPAERLRLLSSVEWEVYYRRRKRQQERRARRLAAWRKFLQQRYGSDIQAIQAAWGRYDIADWVRLPSSWPDRATKEGTFKTDVKEFDESYRRGGDTALIDYEEDAE